MTKQEKIQRYKQLKEELETLTGKKVTLVEASAPNLFKGIEKGLKDLESAYKKTGEIDNKALSRIKFSLDELNKLRSK